MIHKMFSVHEESSHYFMSRVSGVIGWFCMYVCMYVCSGAV